MDDAQQAITTFLTFSGNADDAMQYYVSAFPRGRIVSIARFEKGMRGEEGKVLNGTFELMGQRFMAMDMAPSEAPAFSWATSLLVNCADEAEFDALFKTLSTDGMVMMGPEAVMHLRKVAWVTDRFGVTWQLVWA